MHEIATISISDPKFLGSVFRRVSCASVYRLCKVKEIKQWLSHKLCRANDVMYVQGSPQCLSPVFGSYR